MKFSYSRVGCFGSCPYQYKLRYVDKLQTIPDQDATNALYLGVALHLGLETGSVEQAIESYKSNYNILSDAHINEIIKLEHIIPKALQKLPPGICEVEISTDEFVGYIDRLCPTYVDDNGIQHWDLYDYKYTTNGDRYRTSNQLHIYKYYYELTHPGNVIDKLNYLIINKINIRQKKTETIQQFRLRLQEELEKSRITPVEVSYNKDSITEFKQCCQQLKSVEKFPKNLTKLCSWCQYKDYCESDSQIDYMIINNLKGEEQNMYKKIWVYGEPFSGKTTFATKSPDHLVLSTDGNAQYCTDNFKLITDEVTVNGRITTRKLAWEVFKEKIEELEAGSKYKTIIVDLAEDTYEMCRLFMYKKLNITHESDDSFRAWDKCRTEYLSTMRRLMNLPYDIVLISHEDTSKDITKKSGENITAIKPNLQDKIANKLAGMTALVGRTVCDNGEYTLQIKPDEMTFGGGRLGINNLTIPLDWDEVSKLFEVKKGDK